MKKIKKWLSIGITATMLTFILAACSGDDSSTESSNGKVNLNFWVFGSAGYDILAEEYMKDNPDVQIKVNFTEMNDLHNNLFTSIAAGSGAPDLTMIEISQVAKFLDAKDSFNNLNDYGANELEANYLDWVWNNAQTPDGEFLLGLPTDIGPTTMFYRTDVFEEAGLPTDPTEVAALADSWEEFHTLAKTIKEKTGKNIVDGPELLFNAVRDQAPEQYFNEKDELILESSPYVKEAYDFTTKLIQEGLVGQNGLWSPEWGAAMADGSYGTLLAPSWMVANIKGNAPESGGNWAVTTMPEGAGNWGGSFIAIPKESKYPEEAYDFIQWLTSPEQQLKSFSNNGLFPSAPSVYTEEEFTSFTDEYFNNLPTAKIFAEAAEAVKPVYMGKHYPIVNAELVTALTNVTVNKADPEKEWEEALKRIKTQLERQ
ncbi:ABC transporter substrate-binding protein [Sutcliffiella halmapala]|uniref:ABC transporter substrate-binding protein n=1 Tax=Sutcliffiella halmapala TaxID=79882 RepID=UPI000994DA67|nr:ABC transporter substrate-binding protein [Sutcliffiella halmapala]